MVKKNHVLVVIYKRCVRIKKALLILSFFKAYALALAVYFCHAVNCFDNSSIFKLLFT